MDIKKRCIVYVRVSTAQQVEGVSLDNQEVRCNEWAFRNGILVTRTFREEGVSAKTANRPILQEMLAYIALHHKEIDYLLIYEIDRLSRNVEDFVLITSELKKYHIELRDPSNTLEGSKSDKLIRIIKAVSAEMDNDVKSERVIDNMKRQAADGYRMAKAPYGLKNVRDLLGKSTVEPVKGIGDQISYILTEFSKGTYTIKELLALTNSLNLVRPNGKPFNHAFLGKMLRQPLYAGLEKNKHTNDQLIESIFPGIVSQEVFNRNQIILERKNTKAQGYQVNHEDYPLRRFLVCSNCQKPVRGSAPTGQTGKRYPKYHCPSCPKASISSDELNDQFYKLLESVRPNPITLQLMKTMIVRVWNDELKALHSQRKICQSRIDHLEEHKQKATDKLVSDDITKQEKIQIHQNADKEIIDLRDKISLLSKQMGTKEEAITYVLTYMDNAPRLWLEASTDMRVTYQSMIFPEGIEYDFSQKKFGNPKMSQLYTLANMKTGTSVPENSSMVIPRRIELRLPG